MTDAKGFTLVELLVAIAIIGILAGTAIANYGRMRRVAFDAVAVSDFRNLKTEVLGMAETAPSFLFFNIEGPIDLPAPLVASSLSNGVTAWVMRFRSGFLNLDYVRTDHAAGGKVFLFYELNGQRYETVVRKP